MLKIRRIRAGLYETAHGFIIEHRPDMDGFWYVTYPGERFPDDTYPSLREARTALQSIH